MLNFIPSSPFLCSYNIQNLLVCWHVVVLFHGTPSCNPLPWQQQWESQAYVESLHWKEWRHLNLAEIGYIRIVDTISHWFILHIWIQNHKNIHILTTQLMDHYTLNVLEMYSIMRVPLWLHCRWAWQASEPKRGLPFPQFLRRSSPSSRGKTWDGERDFAFVYNVNSPAKKDAHEAAKPTSQLPNIV